MSDSDGKKTLGLRGGARPGNVKQSFSHGRTKNVVVETKRKRVVVPKPGAQKPTGPGAGPAWDCPSDTSDAADGALREFAVATSVARKTRPT